MTRSGKIGIAITVLVTIVCIHTSNGQDLHFSQFFNSPLTTNPANTGFIPDANYRFGVNYRNQWSSVPVPYKTYSVFGDAQLLRDKWYYGWLGVGGVILQDEAGDGILKSTKMYGSVAYHQLLGNNSLLSLGFNGGVAMKRIDLSKLTFPSQFNDTYGKWFFDRALPSGENFTSSSILYLDVQAGMNYAYFPTDNIYINVGFSAQHLNTPKETFLEGGDNEIGRRYIGFLNASIKVSPQVIVNPNAYYSNQTGASEAVVGAWAAYNLSGPGGDYQLLGGAYYRLNDALIPLIGYQLRQWRLMFSYDVTVSSFSAADKRQGAYELSVVYLGLFPKSGSQFNKRTYLCPHF
ncbi:MAG TPA: PorP/SprF family type IX secretion system membrane protein [Chitinophagaceae bacterium]|jgi:type IX secretion system PorP/SprF family membrane protein|nr:PorP/SprF family type IX secretion system membrane protein [Chitinophagaceae bacterium]